MTTAQPPRRRRIISAIAYTSAALNATMAVIRFKQHFGLFDREHAATTYIFDSATFEID